jgi:hypothetical protein
MADIVTIANFTESMEAEMAKLRLIMEPGLGPLQLQVSSDDEADARAILADPGEPVDEESQTS